MIRAFSKTCLWPRLGCWVCVLWACSAAAPDHLRAADDWRPPPPAGEESFDWIQLKSGEWLKGKIKSLQDEKLEFDSEELNLLTFDWKDIRALRSPRLQSVWIEY